jgi:ubiquitin carboxyl-terminal hydrolase 1
MNPPKPGDEVYYNLDDPNAYRQLYEHGHASTRTTLQYVVLSIWVVVCSVAYHLYYVRNYRMNTPADLLWDAIVFITPASLLDAVDGWVNPPLFPRPMLQTQTRSHAAKSELLGRILGTSKSGNIMGQVFSSTRRATTPASGGGLMQKRDPYRPPGLGNWDNSCYQNSILQGLASLEPLPRYLAWALQDFDAKKTNPETAGTLQTLIAQLNDSSNNGTTLWTPAKLKSMSTWQQQDAQEYFSKLLDDIDKEVFKVLKASERIPGLEAECVSDETAASQHSDDSGYQSTTPVMKICSELRILSNPLEGLVAQRVACVTCGHCDGLSMIPFNCLTLNLEVGKLDYDLYERLDAYTKLESIEGVECGKCTLLKMKRLLPILIERSRTARYPEASIRDVVTRLENVEAALELDDFEDKIISEKCKITAQNRVSSTKTKQTVIARPPQSLAIHVNRSVFNETTGHMFKNLGMVRFPAMLDLGPWCLGSAPGAAHGNRSVDDLVRRAQEYIDGQELEEWLTEPRSSMAAGDREPSKLSGPIYELRAVVTHVGRHENGHYICYRKIPRSAPRHSMPSKNFSSEADDDAIELTSLKSESLDTAWWRLSDENVYQVDEEVVLAQGGVFMLFYDCVEPQPILTSNLAHLSDPVAEDLDRFTAADLAKQETVDPVPMLGNHPSQRQAEGTGAASPLAGMVPSQELAEQTPLPPGDEEDL